MPVWGTFPYDNIGYRHDLDTLRALWPQLHAGDAEPLPSDDAVLNAWAHFHAGDFQQAWLAGLRAGAAGVTVANKAEAIYAHYLEPRETARLGHLLSVAERAEQQTRDEPGNANAHFMLAYAMGRYSQSISFVRASAIGLLGRMREALETAIRLQERHADACIALGTTHAELIDKLTPARAQAEGAKREACLDWLQRGLRLCPGSAIARIEYAHALLVLDGDSQLDQAEVLYTQAAACEAHDALERMQIEMAREALEED